MADPGSDESRFVQRCFASRASDVRHSSYFVTNLLYKLNSGYADMTETDSTRKEMEDAMEALERVVLRILIECCEVGDLKTKLVQKYAELVQILINSCVDADLKAKKTEELQRFKEKIAAEDQMSIESE